MLKHWSIISTWFITILIFILVWCPGFRSPYQFDDYVTPLQDPASQSLTSFAENFFKTLRPLTKLTFAIESSLGLTNAPERRVFQYSLAIGCMLLLMLILEKKGGGKIFSPILALSWATHPVHAETFIALSGRSTLLSLFFVLLSLWSSKKSYQILYAVLAVLSKEVALLFLIYQLIKNKNFNLALASFLLVSLGLVRFRLWQLIEFSWKEVPHFVNWWDNFAGLSSGLYYFIFPSKIGIELDFPLIDSSLWFFVSVFLVVIFLSIVLKYYRRSPQFVADLLLWPVLIFPTQTLILKLDPLALRPLSYSSIVIPILILGPIRNARMVMKGVFLLAALCMLVFLSLTTYSFSSVYQNPIALWTDAKIKAPRKLRPAMNLAYFLVQADRAPEAKVVLLEAKQKWPKSIEVDTKLEAIEILLKK